MFSLIEIESMLRFQIKVPDVQVSFDTTTIGAKHDRINYSLIRGHTKTIEALVRFIVMTLQV
jgi:hypothetical protein